MVSTGPSTISDTAGSREFFNWRWFLKDQFNMCRLQTALIAFTTLLCAPTFGAVTLRPASHLQFPYQTDSNSPGHWDGPYFYIFNSAGHPYRSYGSNLFQLGNTASVTYNNTVNGGRWME